MTTLASKIAAASKDVGGKLRADKRNTDQKYDYISADKILAECGQALAEQGVTVLPSVGASHVEVISRSEGKYRYDATVELELTLTDGESERACRWVGLGSDYLLPDKAMYKAITSGHKYFLMKLLNVGAGNEDGEHETVAVDPDDRKPEVVRTLTATEAQHKATGPVPNCPKCGGSMWDNREGKRNPKAPDFKCRNKECDGAIWQSSASNGTNGTAKQTPAETNGSITLDQIKKIHAIAGNLYRTPDEIKTYREWMQQQFGVESSKGLTQAQASEVIKSLEAAELERAALSA